MQILVSDKARDDLQRVYEYLAEHNRDAAESLLASIDAKFKQLSRFPFLGRERHSLAPALRSALVGTHLIFYQVTRDRIVIVRVIDGRMDIDQEFQR